jgi:hypothetical protein
LSVAIGEALTRLPVGDDPRRRILAIELEKVAAELDADPTGRPALIAALERLVLAVFPSGLVLVDDEMPVDEWFTSMYGRRS